MRKISLMILVFSVSCFSHASRFPESPFNIDFEDSFETVSDTHSLIDCEESEGTLCSYTPSVNSMFNTYEVLYTPTSQQIFSISGLTKAHDSAAKCHETLIKVETIVSHRYQFRFDRHALIQNHIHYPTHGITLNCCPEHVFKITYKNRMISDFLLETERQAAIAESHQAEFEDKF